MILICNIAQKWIENNMQKAGLCKDNVKLAALSTYSGSISSRIFLPSLAKKELPTTYSILEQLGVWQVR
jgi:hypothetical protein